MFNILALFSNFTINANNVITLVTCAKSCIIRYYQIRFIVRNVLNILLNLLNKLLNTIFEITCIENKKVIRVNNLIT